MQVRDGRRQQRLPCGDCDTGLAVPGWLYCAECLRARKLKSRQGPPRMPQETVAYRDAEEAHADLTWDM